MASPLEYRKNARTSPLFYAIFTMGLIFAIGGIAIDPTKYCVEYPCPIWLRALASGLGILFASGAFISMLRGYEYGSRVDVARRNLVWWEGIPPVQEHNIPVDEIKIIQIDLSADDTLVLLDSREQRISLPNQCIPFPYDRWVQQIRQIFPHIEVLEK